MAAHGGCTEREGGDAAGREGTLAFRRGWSGRWRLRPGGLCGGEGVSSREVCAAWLAAGRRAAGVVCAGRSRRGEVQKGTPGCAMTHQVPHNTAADRHNPPPALPHQPIVSSTRSS